MTTALPTLARLKPNPYWAKLPLFNRKGWRTVRFGEVVRMLKEQTDPVADGVERYVAGEHTEKRFEIRLNSICRAKMCAGQPTRSVCGWHRWRIFW